MTPRESEDARFEELMAREFPDGLVPTERARPLLDESPTTPVRPDPSAPGAVRPEPTRLESARPESTRPEPSIPDPPPPEPSRPESTRPDAAPDSSAFRSWTPAEEPDEPFEPPPPAPMARWSSAGLAGTVLVLLPVFLVLLPAFGVSLPMLVWVLAGCGFLAGVALLLYRLRKRPPVDGDGAVL